jgi:hypothetical protein
MVQRSLDSLSPEYLSFRFVQAEDPTSVHRYLSSFTVLAFSRFVCILVSWYAIYVF